MNSLNNLKYQTPRELIEPFVIKSITIFAYSKVCFNVVFGIRPDCRRIINMRSLNVLFNGKSRRN